MTLMASMLLLSQATYAVEMSKTHNQVTQMTTMSKSEAIQMLKDAGVESSKIAMLENGEMAKTEGEFWWWIGYGAAWAGAAAWAYWYTHGGGYGY